MQALAPRASKDSRTVKARWHLGGRLSAGVASLALVAGVVVGGGVGHPTSSSFAAAAGATGCQPHRFTRGEALAAVHTSIGRISTTARALTAGSYPSITDQAGTWATTSATAWTSGFYAGSLWLAYRHTHHRGFETWAERWTAGLAHQAHDTSSHDVGFQLMTSFGNGIQSTQAAEYRKTLLTGARSLDSRFSPTVGAIRSWGNRSNHRHFKVIVDTMMNLELLFWASAHGGPSILRRHATTHAVTAEAHFVRRNGSTRHLVDFSPKTGHVIAVSNPQGYRPGSTWSRGLAWAIHGFTTAYIATGRRDFLHAARRTAAFYLGHVPTDCVPYWDVDAPDIPDAPRDASAAAIAADGLQLLARSDPSAARRAAYRRTTGSILASLARRYVAPSGQAILDGSTATYGVDPSDIGTAYGDYYFLHALLAWLRQR